MSKVSFPSTQYHAKHQNMSQFGKTPRHVIANDHVPNKWASRIDEVTAWWTVMKVADNTEAKSVSIPAVSVLYPSNSSKRTIGGETKRSRTAWRRRRVLQTQKIRLRCRAIMYYEYTMGSYIWLDYYNWIKITLIQGATYRCVESVFFDRHFEFFGQLVGRLQPRILGSGTVGNSGNIGKSDRFPRITNKRGSEDFSFPNLAVADHKIQNICQSRKTFHASIRSRMKNVVREPLA